MGVREQLIDTDGLRVHETEGVALCGIVQVCDREDKVTEHDGVQEGLLVSEGRGVGDRVVDADADADMLLRCDALKDAEDSVADTDPLFDGRRVFDSEAVDENKGVSDRDRETLDDRTGLTDAVDPVGERDAGVRLRLAVGDGDTSLEMEPDVDEVYEWLVLKDKVGDHVDMVSDLELVRVVVRLRSMDRVEDGVDELVLEVEGRCEGNPVTLCDGLVVRDPEESVGV